MRTFVVELDEMLCNWLEHISAVTGESIEHLIAGGIYHQIAMVEGDIYKAFGVHEEA